MIDDIYKCIQLMVAFDITQLLKQNAIGITLAGIGGVLWMLIFPKSTSIFGPSVGVPLGWISSLIFLGAGVYGIFLNHGLPSPSSSKSHFASANSINPYYQY